MERKDIYDGISGISPEFIEEAENHLFAARRMPAVMKWVAVAAALLLFGGVGVYAASSGFNVRKLTVNGYEVSASISRIPMYKITGKVREASDIILNQYKTFPVFSNLFPGSYYKKADSAEEAAAYVGYDKLQIPAFPYDRAEITVAVTGDPKGRLQAIQIMQERITGTISVQNWAMLFTKHYDQDVLEIEYPNDIDSEMTEFTTGAGLQCLVFHSDAEVPGRMGLTGYITTGDVVYMCHTAFYSNGRAKAEQILHDWAESLK